MTKLGEVILRGLRAAQPAFGVEGRLYYVTDESKLERDSGSAWQDISTGAAVADADYGNITVSGSGAVWTIDNDVVTFAKMQNISTDRLIGRDTAGSGDPEEVSVGGGLEFTGGPGIQRSALTGDVTASAGSGATTIANDAVTYAKMQNVSATSRLLGRVSAGSGDVEEVTTTTLLDLLQNGSAGLLFEHFLNIPPPNSGSMGLGLVTNASGSNSGVSQVAPPDAASLGVIDISTGTATNGRAGIFSYNASPGASIRLGGGQLDLTWRFYVPTLPTAGDDFEMTIGFIDSVNSSHTDGVYLLLSNASANFRYITRSNSVTTNTDSGLAAVAATWYKLRIVVNAAATSVTFTIDGGSSQSPATNIPTGAGREVGIGAGMTKAGGTNARSVYIDYARFAWSGVSA